MSDKITVCPECESSHINLVSTRNIRNPKNDWGKYHCGDCDHRFDEPATREPRHVGTRTGLAGRLADPEITSIEDLLGGDPA